MKSMKEGALKKTVLFVQLFFALIFLVTFVCTYFLKDRVLSDSRQIITEKVSSGIYGKIDFIEEVINAKKAKALLADYQIEVINREISDFRNDPNGYVREMTLKSADQIVLPSELKTDNKLKNALIQKVFGWKEKIRTHFNASFDGLVLDIRIFLLSNVIGLIVAAIVNWRADQIGRHAFVYSMILTGVIILSSYFYINSNWFYDVLLNSYVGTGYPIGVLSMSAWLFWSYFTVVLKRDKKNLDERV